MNYRIDNYFINRLMQYYVIILVIYQRKVPNSSALERFAAFILCFVSFQMEYLWVLNSQKKMLD